MDQPQSVVRPLLTLEPELGLIHRVAATKPGEIKDLLMEAHQSGVTFQGGLGPELDRENVQIDAVRPDYIQFTTNNFDYRERARVTLTFRCRNAHYLITARLTLADKESNRIRIAIPKAIYIVEQRERVRRPGGIDNSTPASAMIRSKSIVVRSVRVVDYSDDGALLEIPSEVVSQLDRSIELSFNDGADAGSRRTAFPKNSRTGSPGLTQIGIQVTAAPPGDLIPVERRSTVLPNGRARSSWRRLKLASDGARIVTRRVFENVGIRRGKLPAPDLVRFQNARGESLVALRDSWLPQQGAPVVLIPPAWAKTKETLLPLARTLVATFRRANEPISVLRLDGIRRRGESHRDPECIAPGTECLKMTFSQGVDDIRAGIEYVSNSPEFDPCTIIIVTFSGAAIEARKALAEDNSKRVGGWVSVVGAADLLSGLRVLSGGQDYIGGYERGVRFGRQRVLGIETDADLVCEDAIRHHLAHLEDARQQMARISTPVTWIQGRDDAWIDQQRVREILSCGDSLGRRLIEVPTGHQLRTSREALDVFQLIASEVGRFATGEPLPPELPDFADLELRRRVERARLPKPSVDLAAFWREYLLGRGSLPGMELLTTTTPYRDLMSAQITRLAIAAGDRVVDIASGIGTLSTSLVAESQQPAGARIDELDFIVDALRYSRTRKVRTNARQGTYYVQCDLGALGCHVPIQNQIYDAALASLVINYVKDPGHLLREVHRVLRRNGRLVLSALRPDTDISKIYVQAADEVRSAKASGGFDDLSWTALESALASCLNDAAMLVDLEEQGLFHFWEPDELARFVRDAGFGSLQFGKSFGDPPQAIVISARAMP